MSNPSTLKPFQKGSDPRRNLNGRPVGSTTFRQQLLKLLTKEVDTKLGKMKVMEVMVHRLLDKAIKGDMRAVKLVFDIVDGPVQKQKRYLEAPQAPPFTEAELARMEAMFGDGAKKESTQ